MSIVSESIRHTLPASTGFLPLDALRWRASDAAPFRLFLVGQSGLFAEDEQAWAHDDGGQWRGPAPCRAVPENLRVENSLESFMVGADEILRVAGGQGEVWARCELQEAGGVSGGIIEFVLQNASTGLEIARFYSPFVPARASLTSLADGAYLLLARLQGASAIFRLPDEYARNDSLYKWGENKDDYWDYSVNVGRLPLAGHEFFARRAALLDSNAQNDVPAWADYIIANSDDERGGEWSARGFVVGNGPWAPMASLIPASGPALFEISGLNARTALGFDPFCRTLNVLKKRDSGELLMAGQRMTPSGLNAALWFYDGQNGALLGHNENPSTGMCECALANHGPTSIVESGDGPIYVLTKCSLHIYDAGAPRIAERLPGVPASTHGHPGGHSLVEIEGRQFFTSENFGATDWTDERGETRAQFYDFLSIQQGARRAQGPGTVFHGTGDLTAFFGRLWGVMQDKPHSEIDARQFISWFDGGDWSFETSLIYPAKFFRWQRLCGVEGLPDFAGKERQILLAFGKTAASEQGIIGGGDGRNFTWEEWPYRIRRASVSPQESGDSNSVLIIARATSEAGIDASAWHLLEIVAAQPDDGSGGQEDERSDVPEGATVAVVRLRASENRPIHAVQILEAGRERIGERFNREFRALRLRADSSAAPDDWATYDFEARYSRFEPLPRAARWVDVLFYLPPASSEMWDGETDIIPVVARRN